MNRNANAQTADTVPALSMADFVQGDDYAGYRNPPAYFVPLKVRQELAAAEGRKAAAATDSK